MTTLTPKKKASAKPSPDDKVMELLDTVRRQKAAIAEAERPVFRTNLTFSYTDGSLNQAINVRVITDVAALIKMAAHVASQATAYHRAAGELGVFDNVPPFMWCNYSAEDWIHDLRLTVSKIRIKSQRDKLQALEARLDLIITPEKRRELEILAIEKDLGSTL